MNSFDKTKEDGRASEKSEDALSHGPCLIKVIADFGGRRKIFDRRLRQIPIRHEDHRSGQERRSGFDRRSAIRKIGICTLQRRKAEAIQSSDAEFSL